MNKICTCIENYEPCNLQSTEKTINHQTMEHTNSKNITLTPSELLSHLLPS